jgi:hypothetical protein
LVSEFANCESLVAWVVPSFSDEELPDCPIKNIETQQNTITPTIMSSIVRIRERVLVGAGGWISTGS